MTPSEDRILVRRYGDAGPAVVLLHGGPGAPGYMAPVARGLADACRVFEPLQRRRGPQPLTVERHIDDLEAVLRSIDGRPIVIGHSWGAMLALAHAAVHPGRPASLVLVGCGTFDRESRRVMAQTCDDRLGDDGRARLEALSTEITDADERLRLTGDLLLPVYSRDLLSHELPLERCDFRGHEETWQDMLERQRRGDYPAAFARIDLPVLMLHGADDPHPGARIRDGLLPHLPQLEYLEWNRCGHYPWLERAASEEFFAVLRRRIAAMR